MKKQIPALIASLLITSIVGIGMFAMGVNALLNKDSVPIQNSPNTNILSDGSSTNLSQSEQMQNLIAQYQEREKEYQDELSATRDQLDQALAMIQQYQGLFQYLQGRGLIQIDRDGRVFIPDD
jgi:hypothetical protein